MLRKMRQRRGTAAAWSAANPLLLLGEIGIITDANKKAIAWKIGDGVVVDGVLTGTLWNDLPEFLSSAASPTGKYLRDDGTWHTPAGGGGGGDVPTGTGFRHVTTGSEDSAAKLVANADVASDAAIAESKLNLNSPTHAKQHAVDAAADHTSTATPGKMLKAATTTGLPAEATNTDAEVADAVTKKHSNGLDHARSHAVDSSSDHTSDATPGVLLKAKATTGLPTGSSVTEADAASAVSLKHAANGDTDLDSTFEAMFEKVANKGANSGYCALDSGGKVDGDKLPAFSTTKRAGVPAVPSPSGAFLKDDGTWAASGGGVTDHGALTGLADNDHPQYQLVTPQTLTDGANIAWNLASGGQAKVTLGGNRTLNNPTNLVAGTVYTLRVIQDGTGTRLLSYGALYLWPGGVPPTLTATAGATDVLVFLCDGTSLLCMGAAFDMK